ncbi:MAG TPA: hypothetical protein VM345_02785, partial [Acidimicrobiales bacterium]|nr:hypothetical protein [Acidimicrobiales bacterium]
AVDTSGGTVSGGGATTGGTGGTGATATGGATGTSRTGGSTSPSGGQTTTAGGDRSHCKGDRQHDIIYNAPPCVPKWPAGADNGGATYPGVTKDSISFVMFQCQSNEQVDAILASQGLAASDAETDAMLDAWAKVINKHYETYGRTFKWERIRGDCPTSPPDPAKARQAAAEVAKKKPMFVHVAGGGSAAADVFAQNGILSVGVQWNIQQFYAGRRPFRWDIFPSANETADWMAEYYCKKMAKKPASNAGQVIHPTIGGRSTIRKLAIVVPDDGTGTIVPAAQQVSKLVTECSGVETPIFTYQSDINRATEQTRATVAGLIEKKITTVTCMCDPIAPVFLTQGMTQNNYYPEHMLAGMGLLDYDVLGRLYDPAQWAHAFGPSQLAEPVPFDQSDATRIWRAAGNSGQPCAACNLLSGYMSLVASMINVAGPNLNPGTIEAALVGRNYKRGGWGETGGKADVYLIKFGQGDYNAISDFREAYWDAAATSTIDGRAGAYVSLNKGRRYAGGELDGSFTVAPKPQ